MACVTVTVTMGGATIGAVGGACSPTPTYQLQGGQGDNYK